MLQFSHFIISFNQIENPWQKGKEPIVLTTNKHFCCFLILSVIPHKPANSSLSEVHIFTCWFIFYDIFTVLLIDKKDLRALFCSQQDRGNYKSQMLIWSEKKEAWVRSDLYNLLPQTDTGIKIWQGNRTEECSLYRERHRRKYSQMWEKILGFT